jgi:hypothetical protein
MNEELDESVRVWTETAAAYARVKRRAIIASVGLLIALAVAIVMPLPLWSCAVLGLLSGAALGHIVKCDRYRKGALRMVERLSRLRRPA